MAKVTGGIYKSDGTRESYVYDTNTNITTFTEGPRAGMTMQGEPAYRPSQTTTSDSSSRRGSGTSRSGSMPSESTVYPVTLPSGAKTQIVGDSAYQRYKEALYRYTEDPSNGFEYYLKEMGFDIQTASDNEKPMPGTGTATTENSGTNWLLVAAIVDTAAMIMFSGNGKKKRKK